MAAAATPRQAFPMSTTELSAEPQRALLLGLPRLGASLVAATLDEAGIESVTAADMRAAAAVAADGSIDLCVVDLDHFGATATAEIAQLAERWPSVRTVGIGARATTVPTDAVVERPFAPRTLLAAVRAAQPQTVVTTVPVPTWPGASS